MWRPLQAQAPEPHGAAAPTAEAMKAGVFEEASALPVLASEADGTPRSLAAAPADSLPPETQPAAGEPSRPDSLAADTVAQKLRQLSDSVDSAVTLPALPKKRFVPNPKRALWLSLVVPGAGQIYNRKYWKLPIIYGGFLGCTYAFMWNQQMYRDYSQAYLDIMDDDPRTDSYLDMLPPRYDITGREEQFKNIFKRKKDFYRRYRDLSAFCFVGVYLLSVIDAYVDAQLSEFDITTDLSMRVHPSVIGGNGTIGQRTAAYGLGCSLNF